MMEELGTSGDANGGGFDAYGFVRCAPQGLTEENDFRSQEYWYGRVQAHRHRAGAHLIVPLERM